MGVHSGYRNNTSILSNIPSSNRWSLECRRNQRPPKRWQSLESTKVGNFFDENPFDLRVFKRIVYTCLSWHCSKSLFLGRSSLNLNKMYMKPCLLLGLMCMSFKSTLFQVFIWKFLCSLTEPLYWMGGFFWRCEPFQKVPYPIENENPMTKSVCIFYI